MSVSLAIAAASLTAWVYLLAFRGMFWLCRERDGISPHQVASQRSPANGKHPRVVAVVPARNEADCIWRALRSLEAQDYPGEFRIVVVDDQSTDDTADLVRSLRSDRICLISGSARPSGWTGKLWALQQGADLAGASEPEFLWLTDADIVHSPDNLSRLVERAESGDLVLVSLMAKLACDTLAERLLISAFVFFFAMLYPFAWVNNVHRKTAAAAGGCMLVRRRALLDAGSLAAVRGAIIDDCALARRLKAQGPVWLGLTSRSVSIRPYGTFGDIRAMVSRSAFAQLDYSWSLVVLTTLGMGAVYVAPPVLAITGIWPGALCGSGGVARHGRGPDPNAAILPTKSGLGICLTRHGGLLWRIHREFCAPTLARARRDVERPSPGGAPFGESLRRRHRANCSASLAPLPPAAGEPSDLSSGKGHRDENFPVASLLIAPRHRDIILAFYRFVREADDIADHPQASAEEKLRMLEECVGRSSARTTPWKAASAFETCFRSAGSRKTCARSAGSVPA